MTDHPEPIFTHDEPGPQFKAKDIALQIARGGVPHPTAAARVANYAKARQIHVRGKAGRGAANSPSLFAISDMAAALILSNLQDLGVAGQEILSDASITLYAWTVGQNATAPSPILAALRDTWAGNPWMLQVRSMRHAGTQQRLINRSFVDMRAPSFWSAAEIVGGDQAWAPVGEIMINTACLAPLQSLIAPPKGAH